MKSFAKQFIGTWTWRVLVGSLILHVVAFFARDTIFELPALIVSAAVTLVVSVVSLPAGIMIAFSELFVGGHGHLLETEIFGFSLSLRMVIFACVMLVWLIWVINKDVHVRFYAMRDIPWLILFIAVVLAGAIGFFRNNLGMAFDDMNGYLWIGYLLPIISIEWTNELRRDLLQVLFAGSIWLALFTLALSFAFTHLDGDSLHVLYTFVRDSRLAEITLQTVAKDSGEVTNALGASILGDQGYWYRIFMQSQFFVMTTFALIVTAIFFIWRDQRMPWTAGIAVALFVSALGLSMSRSFLLGLLVASASIFVLAFFHGKKPIVNIARRLLTSVLLFALGCFIAYVSIAFPFPVQPNINEAAFYSTSADANREMAVSSRWALLGPMMTQIYMHPVFGSGFGKEVTFVTDDPRIREIIPSGEYTTYRFEWGYQDIWLKMGILGLFAFAWYAAVMFIAIRFTAKKHGHAWLVIGLGMGLLAMFVTHIFSPYLNHPIGIGYMLFVLPFIDWEGMSKKVKRIKEEQVLVKMDLLAQSVQQNPVMTSQKDHA